MARTIYDEIGGATTLTVVVDGLYRRLLADPDLRAYFEGHDLARVKAHQRALVTVALGGTSEEYGGRMLHSAHTGLGIPDQAFDRFLDHLAEVLAGAGVDDRTSAQILAIVLPVRTDVVQPAVGASPR